MTKLGQILCIGRDKGLLDLRCEVLAQSGYSAESVTLDLAEEVLRQKAFDLIVLSQRVTAELKQSILALAGSAQCIHLEGFTSPQDLLDRVAKG